MLTTQVHPPSQFNRHLVETLDRIRDTVRLFQKFTYDPVDRDPGKRELQTIRMSIPRRVPDQKQILTSAAATTASFHENPANVAFAHSLKSGAGVGELQVAQGVGAFSCRASFKVAPPSLSVTEKY